MAAGAKTGVYPPLIISLKLFCTNNQTWYSYSYIAIAVWNDKGKAICSSRPNPFVNELGPLLHTSRATIAMLQLLASYINNARGEKGKERERIDSSYTYAAD